MSETPDRVPPQNWIPFAHLALCGSEHSYDSSRYVTCPACGQEDRAFIRESLEKLRDRVQEMERRAAGLVARLEFL